MIEASLLLGLARLAILFLPFSRIARWLGVHMAETAAVQPPDVIALSRRVQHAVETAAAHLPWQSVCLPQAIAAKTMLGRRGVPCTLYLGVLHSGMEAHAWVRVGEVVVTGERNKEGHTVVSTFA